MVQREMMRMGMPTGLWTSAVLRDWLGGRESRQGLAVRLDQQEHQYANSADEGQLKAWRRVSTTNARENAVTCSPPASLHCINKESAHHYKGEQGQKQRLEQACIAQVYCPCGCGHNSAKAESR